MESWIRSFERDAFPVAGRRGVLVGRFSRWPAEATAAMSFDERAADGVLALRSARLASGIATRYISSRLIPSPTVR